MNFFFWVLWRIFFIVRYIPTEPPITDRNNNVDSGVRHPPLRALRLSWIVTPMDKKLIARRYPSKNSLISIFSNIPSRKAIIKKEGLFASIFAYR